MRTVTFALLFAALGTVPLAAQQVDLSPPRFTVGGAFTYADARGEFGEVVNSGFGFAAHGVLNPGRQQVFGLRFDADFLNYGTETRRVALGPTIGGRILLDLVTSNNIVMLGMGPQVVIPTPGVQPYLHAGIGYAFLQTVSSLRGDRGGDTFATTENFDDGAFAWSAGGGLRVPLSSGRSPVSLDLAVRYRHTAEVYYLREGDIRDNADGSISFTPRRSDVDLLGIQLGATVGLR